MYGLPLHRARLYFIGTEVHHDYVNDCVTGNDEAALDLAYGAERLRCKLSLIWRRT